MQKLTNFVKYNNAFIIILGALFLVAGSSFASEKVRDVVIGQTVEEINGMDNSALLSADLKSLKQDLKIDDVSEDEESYYVVYSFSTFDVKDRVWKNIVKNQTLKVPKEALNGGKDLGLFVQSELSQVLDSHLAYLKDAQDKERKKGATKIVKTVKYTGLKGLVLNSETKELDGYEPVIKKEDRDVVQSNFAGVLTAISSSSSSAAVAEYYSSSSVAENSSSSVISSSSPSSSSSEIISSSSSSNDSSSSSLSSSEAISSSSESSPSQSLSSESTISSSSSSSESSSQSSSVSSEASS